MTPVPAQFCSGMERICFEPDSRVDAPEAMLIARYLWAEVTYVS